MLNAWSNCSIRERNHNAVGDPKNAKPIWDVALNTSRFREGIVKSIEIGINAVEMVGQCRGRTPHPQPVIGFNGLSVVVVVIEIFDLQENVLHGHVVFSIVGGQKTCAATAVSQPRVRHCL